MHIVRIQKEVFAFQIDGSPAISTPAQYKEYAPSSHPPRLRCDRINIRPTSPIAAGPRVGQSAALPVIFMTPILKRKVASRIIAMDTTAQYAMVVIDQIRATPRPRREPNRPLISSSQGDDKFFLDFRTRARQTSVIAVTFSLWLGVTRIALHHVTLTTDF